MNREIKFRVWDAETNSMVYFDLKDVQQNLFSIRLLASRNDWSNPVMQYTGLKDKNGVEIYEGDVNQNGDTLVYSKIHARFGWTDGGYLLHINSDYDEVIGNIYENPELLK